MSEARKEVRRRESLAFTYLTLGRSSYLLIMAMPFTDAMVGFAVEDSRGEADDIQGSSFLLRALLWQGNAK